MKIVLNGLVSKLLVAIFMILKFSKTIIQLTTNSMKALIFTKKLNPHSYVYVKNCTLDFGQMNEFLVYFIMFLPHESPEFLGQKCR